MSALTAPFASAAGPYAPAAGQTGSTAVANLSSSIVGWATSVISLTRGPRDINAPSGSLATFGSESEAIGYAQGNSSNVVSLGDGGSITLAFAGGIKDGAGADFAVFENGFSDSFLELGFVEVSSNGADFFRFESHSLTPATPQIGGFGALDPTNLDGLAGKYRQGFGTPFDLHSLAGTSGLDVNDVRFVRIIDVVGRIDAAPGNPGWTVSRDTDGHIINDPYTTPFESGGLDLDGIGVMNAVPEPTGAALFSLAALLLGRRRRCVGAPSENSPDQNSKNTNSINGMLFMKSFALLLPAASLWFAFVDTSHAVMLVNFNDKTLPAQGFYNGDHGTGSNSDGWSSGGAFFNNTYTYDPVFGPIFGGFWTGFSYSNVIDSTTAGYSNQYAAYPGGGVGGSGTYAVGFSDGAFINLPAFETASSVSLTNTTYAALSMKEGDFFAKKFGGPTGDDPDFFKVILTGFSNPDGGGTQTGFVEKYLADFRFADNTQDYILNSWETVDLTALGSAKSIVLSYDSSDSSFGFLNTPTYVALDNLSLVPEPVMTGMAVTLGLLLSRRRRVAC